MISVAAITNVASITQDTQYLESVAIPGAPTAGTINDNIRYVSSVGVVNPAGNSIADYARRTITAGRNFEFYPRSSLQNPNVANTYSAYSQVTASAAHSIVQIFLEVYIAGAGTDGWLVGIATGPGGSETLHVGFSLALDATGHVSAIINVDPTIFSKGTRIAVAVNCPTSVTQYTNRVSMVLNELND